MASGISQSAWEAHTAGLSVQLSEEALSEIDRLVMHGFKAIPKRGAETGGVLYGSAKDLDGELTVAVERAAPIEVEYRYGPSFRLSEDDESRLAAQLRTGPEPVGLFRSETRVPSGIADEDRDLLRRHFPVNGVFLLIQPVENGESRLRMFALRRGEVVSSVEEAFPFGSRYWRPKDAAAAPLPDQTTEGVPQLVRDGETEAAASSTGSGRLIRYAAAAAVLLAVGATSYWIGRASRAPSHAAAPPVPSRLPPAPRPTLGLAVELVEDRVRITWEPRSPLLKNGVAGELTILDGGLQTTQSLSPRQLGTGSYFYKPSSTDVSFTMKVNGAEPEIARLVLGSGGSEEGKNPGAPAASDSPLSGSEVREGIERTLRSWASALQRGDVDSFVAHYAPLMDVYFTQTRVNRSAVEREVRQMLDRYGAFRELEVRPIEIRPAEPGHATALIHKRWRTAGPRVFAGEEEESLDFVRRDGRWLIANERETRVFWVER